jgi:hypothetical protein
MSKEMPIKGIKSWLSHMVHLQNHVEYYHRCPVCLMRGNQGRSYKEIIPNIEMYEEYQKSGVRRVDY